MAKFEDVANALSRRVRDGVYTTSQRHLSTIWQKSLTLAG